MSSYRPHPLGLGNVLRSWPDGTAVVVAPACYGPMFLVITGDGELLSADGGVRPIAEALIAGFTEIGGIDFGSEIDATLAVESRRNSHPENR